MKKITSLLTLSFLLLFILSISNCRSLTGTQRKTKKERNIRYQQKKIDESRGIDNNEY